MKTMSQTLIWCSVLIMHEPQATVQREESRRSEDLVGGGQLGPRLVCPAIVVLSLGDLHVLVEAQDLSGLKFSDGGSLTQLQKKAASLVSFGCYGNRASDLLWVCSLTFLVSRRLISLTSACLSAWFLAEK